MYIYTYIYDEAQKKVTLKKKKKVRKILIEVKMIY